MIIAVGSQENNFISYFHYFLMNALSSVSSKVISLLIPITTLVFNPQSCSIVNFLPQITLLLIPGELFHYYCIFLFVARLSGLPSTDGRSKKC